MKKEQINLLLVDDEDALLESIRRRLQVRDFNVIAVNRGEKALDVARTHLLDVAILDLKMPGMSGKDVLIALKRDYPWLEVIILTGHGSFDPENEKEFGKAYTYLSKPCGLDTLLRTLVEAYKKTVMNRQGISPEEMASHLSQVDAASPRDLLKKLKELDGNRQ
ncbi:MAG: response regulator [Desulfobacterales bacterium]|nr:response regulator [Desulfobacterales bacterium]